MSEPSPEKSDAESNDEDEEESVEQLNDTTLIPDDTLNTSFSQSLTSTMIFPATMPMSLDMMVLHGTMILPEEAEESYEQALRCPTLTVHECMKRTQSMCST